MAAPDSACHGTNAPGVTTETRPGWKSCLPKVKSLLRQSCRHPRRAIPKAAQELVSSFNPGIHHTAAVKSAGRLLIIWSPPLRSQSHVDAGRVRLVQGSTTPPRARRAPPDRRPTLSVESADRPWEFIYSALEGTFLPRRILMSLASWSCPDERLHMARTQRFLVASRVRMTAWIPGSGAVRRMPTKLPCEQWVAAKFE